MEEIEMHKRSADLSRQITRRWRAGDIYAPKDLSGVEMAKWKNRGKPDRDVFDVLQFDPREHYKVRLFLLIILPFPVGAWGGDA
jgi:small subunit ribosomal protein S18